MARDPAATSAGRPASSEQDADPLDDLPPSALFVRYVLRHVGPLTTSEIVDETSMPEGTVRSALVGYVRIRAGWFGSLTPRTPAGSCGISDWCVPT